MTPLRIVFAGTPEFAVPALDALHAAGHRIVAVYTQPDRPAGRGRTIAASPVKQRALQLGLPIEQPATFKAAAAQEQLAAYAPDVMIVVAYGLLLPQAVLDIPRLGCLNIHASLLPRWRGAAPIQRAVQAGDERSGVSIMQMEAGLDTGPELLRREIALAPRETGGSLHDRLAPLGAEAIVAALPGWAAGTLHAVPQPEAGATYARKLRKEEADLDWSRPVVELDRQVRAFNPWPVAVTTLAGEPVRIWQSQPLPGAAPTDVAPGTVVTAADGRILVAAGDGLLELQTLQFPGRKPLAARDVLNSRSLAGACFGAGPA